MARLNIIFCVILVAIAGYSVSWSEVGLLPTIGLAFLGLFLADIHSGFYHFIFDHFEFKFFKPFNEQHEMFQLHHQDPMEICQGTIDERLMLSILSGTYPTLLLLPFVENLYLHQLFFWFILLATFTQQCHSWAHEIRPPRIIKMLQRLKLVTTRLMHGIHHIPPYTKNYAIVTGWSNVFLNPFFDWLGPKLLKSYGKIIENHE